MEIREKVTSGELIPAFRVVGFEHELVIAVAGAGAEVSDLLVRAVGERNGVEEELRHRAQPAGRNLVTGEWNVGYGINQLCSRQQAGEIARSLGGRRHERDLTLRRVAKPRALVGAKVKQVVFLERAAHGAAELVALELIVLGREKAAGIHLAVTQELVNLAIAFIRPRF